MKKLITLFLILISAPAFSDPVFSGKDSQLSFGLGLATVNTGLIVAPTRFVPYTESEITYSQPNPFFRLPGRQNVHLYVNTGYGKKYGWNWKSLDDYVFAMSQDVFFYSNDNWYFGTGLGAGMQLRNNDRVGSYLLFQFKLMTGFKINEILNAEIFFKHLSNGHTTDNNMAYNMYGLSIVRKF